MFDWVLIMPLKTIPTGNWVYANNSLDSKTFEIIWSNEPSSRGT